MLGEKPLRRIEDPFRRVVHHFRIKRIVQSYA
jgi:hypothetical protein